MNWLLLASMATAPVVGPAPSPLIKAFPEPQPTPVTRQFLLISENLLRSKRHRAELCSRDYSKGIQYLKSAECGS